MPILGRVIDILQEAGKDTAVDMAVLLKREALDVIGGSLPPLSHGTCAVLLLAAGCTR